MVICIVYIILLKTPFWKNSYKTDFAAGVNAGIFFLVGQLPQKFGDLGDYGPYLVPISLKTNTLFKANYKHIK